MILDYSSHSALKLIQKYNEITETYVDEILYYHLNDLSSHNHYFKYNTNDEINHLSKCYCNFSCLETHVFTTYNDSFLKCQFCGQLKKKTGFTPIIKPLKEEETDEEI